MILIIITLICIGFYFAYQTSRRTATKKMLFDRWLFERGLFAKLFSLLLFLVAIVIGAYFMCVTSSFFYTLVALMLLGSFTILLMPISFPGKK